MHFQCYKTQHITCSKCRLVETISSTHTLVSIMQIKLTVGWSKTSCPCVTFKICGAILSSAKTPSTACKEAPHNKACSSMCVQFRSARCTGVHALHWCAHHTHSVDRITASSVLVVNMWTAQCLTYLWSIRSIFSMWCIGSCDNFFCQFVSARQNDVLPPHSCIACVSVLCALCLKVELTHVLMATCNSSHHVEQ